MSSDTSSDNEAPQEVSLSEAKRLDQYRLRNVVQQRKKQPKAQKAKSKAPEKQIDADLLAALESGLGADADLQLQTRQAKLERTERPTQMVSINPSVHQVEQKIGNNLKVVCLKKIPVIATNEKFRGARDSILHRSSLNRRPLKLNK
jgi:K+-transporting ATPase c subunit